MHYRKQNKIIKLTRNKTNYNGKDKRNKQEKGKETFGWWGALSTIRDSAWLTSTQMQSLTTTHIALYADDGTEIQCTQEQTDKLWILS